MSHYTIGIDLGGTNIKGAIFNSQFELVSEKRIPTVVACGSNYVLNKIIQLIDSLINSLNLSADLIDCMGMGIPGLLDPQKGLSLFSPNFPDWENVEVVKEMRKHFEFPTYIDNDVRVNLYGEWLHGAGIGTKNLVLLTLGTGLGSGIVMDGKVIYGTTASAGEIGHMNMYRQGRSCKCGSSGCLGRYVSAIGMVRTFVEKLQSGRKSIVQQWVNNDVDKITADMLSKAYDLEDSLAAEVMHETGEILGFGLTNVINLFNPEMIIIGGGMSLAGERLLKTTREIINNHALKISNQACTIIQAQLGDASGMIGAASYAKTQLALSNKTTVYFSEL